VLYEASILLASILERSQTARGGPISDRSADRSAQGAAHPPADQVPSPDHTAEADVQDREDHVDPERAD
jgi:hypothetical protein